MSRTFDVVVSCDGPGDTLVEFVADQLSKGRRALVVLAVSDTGEAQRLRRRLLAVATAGHLTVMGYAEIACVSGNERPEAVVIRRRGTGKLVAVNAAAVLKGLLDAPELRLAELECGSEDSGPQTAGSQ